VFENLKIRKATQEDLPFVLDLYATDELHHEEILTVSEAIDIFNKFSAYPNYSLYVASFDGTIVGTFELLIMDNLGHKGSPTGVIEDVLVDTAYRSKGIGAMMMQHAIDLCSEYRCYKLTLSSNLKRERAHSFYENLGFVKHGFSFKIDIN